MKEQRIQRILDEMPGWNAADAVVAPLSGGITNTNYRIDLRGETFVLRVSGENTELLGILCQRLANCLRVAKGERGGRVLLRELLDAMSKRELARLRRALRGVAKADAGKAEGIRLILEDA